MYTLSRRTPAAARMPEDYKSLLAQQRATVHSLVSHRKAEAAAKWMDAAQVHPSKGRAQAHPGWWSSSDEEDEVSMGPGPTVQTPWGASDRWRTVQSPSESAQARTRSRSRRGSSPGSEVRVRREHGLRVPTSPSAKPAPEPRPRLTSPSAKPAPEPRPRLSSLALRREQLRQGPETHRLKEHGASADELGLDLAVATARRAAAGLSGGKPRLQAAAAARAWMDSAHVEPRRASPSQRQSSQQRSSPQQSSPRDASPSPRQSKGIDKPLRQRTHG